MPRRNNQRTGRSGRADRPAPTFGNSTARREAGPAFDGDEEYIVRPVPGARATKHYRCPGCDQEIFPGVAHVVVWPSDRIGGADDRRHWHTGCWSGRRTRGLTRRWS